MQEVCDLDTGGVSMEVPSVCKLSYMRQECLNNRWCHGGSNSRSVEHHGKLRLPLSGMLNVNKQLNDLEQ